MRLLLLFLFTLFGLPLVSQTLHFSTNNFGYNSRNTHRNQIGMHANKFPRPVDFYFDDHRPCWVIGAGPNVLLSDVYYFDPDNGSQGTGISESSFGIGLAVCGGLNVPIITISENASLGINVVPSLYGGLGYIGFSAPATLMLKYGVGATHYHTSESCIGVGAGYGISGMQYYELFAYAYSTAGPFFVLEFGLKPVVMRFEIFERKHIADLPAPNTAKFLEFNIHFLHYFEDKD